LSLNFMMLYYSTDRVVLLLTARCGLEEIFWYLCPWLSCALFVLGKHYLIHFGNGELFLVN